MLGLLRFIRGFFGIVFVLQAFQVVEAVVWLATPESAGADIGKFFALLLFKAIVLGICGFLFFWLRGLINRLYFKKHGVSHPALAEKKWSL